ncbi:hypothetical protein QTQ03_21585 [Micromonospora sp. WMMA1363]|uniref:hypothetical protein n=1 Tax=Micromonospora sp. WMMA1363 TaxID=3053985 RepID=UPI00259CA4BF|nr:hypothetical protein [Micromonospora sp. WMMA1363]MDM4722052.1 hypothetical protein [Micromonospora sp. WMMA1363]
MGTLEEEGIRVQRSRFVFLAAPMPEPYQGQAADGIVWMLVSPNNRPLGRGPVYHEAYAQCREAVLDLQANVDRVVPLEGTVPASGQWTWRIELDDALVALSSRSYLRARECSYNLERFLEALPQAEVVLGVRSVRRDRRRVAEPLPPAGGVPGGPPYRPSHSPYQGQPRRELRHRDGGAVDRRRHRP